MTSPSAAGGPGSATVGGASFASAAPEGVASASNPSYEVTFAPAANALRWRVPRWVAAARPTLEWVLLLGAAPLLVFPSPFTLVGAALLATAWLLRRAVTGRWSVPTAADWPARVLVVALCLSLVPSVRLDYSAPKFWGLVLDLATFFTTVNTLQTDLALRRARLAMLGLGVALAIVGVLGMGEPAEKGFIPHPTVALPHLFGAVRSSTVVTNGFPPNELGGILTLFTPLAAALSLSRGRMRCVAAPAFLLLAATLVLTESRAAVVGTTFAVCVGLLVLVRKRPLALGVLALLAGLAAVGGYAWLAPLLASDAAADLASNLTGRVEVWQRALTMLVDMPITGIGLNTFPVILRSFYPTVHHEGWAVLPHAHNLLLQTGLDLGLPGLAAFLGVVASAVRGGLAAARTPQHRTGAIGLLLGLLAFGAFSLVDAVTLGSKPSPALWAVLGLLVALGRRPRAEARVRHMRLTVLSLRARAALALALVLWLSVVLVAPVALNAARLGLHGSWTVMDPRFVGADLDWASALAWGPYSGRTWAARALAASQRGDPAQEMQLLQAAFQANPWDAAVGLRLGDLRWAHHDWDGAVQAWRAAGANELLVERGRQSPSLPTALDWFAAAQSVDPTNWQAYATAAARLEHLDPARAATLVAQALRVRGTHPARDAIAERLLDPQAPLPADPLHAVPSSADGQLYEQASHVFAGRGDHLAALMAAQLAVQAAGSLPSRWQTLAAAWQAEGRPELAQQALVRAAALEHR